MDIPQDIKIEINPAAVDHVALGGVRRYWDDVRGSRRMPARRDIDPSDLKQWLPQVLLADVLPNAEDLRYRLLGTRLRPFFPGEATGQLFTEALSPFGQETVVATLDIYRKVTLERAPLFIRGPGAYFAQNSKFFQALLMPLGDSDHNVNMIFGAFEFDWVQQQM